MSKEKYSITSNSKNTQSQGGEPASSQTEYLLSLTKKHNKFKDQYDTPYVRFKKDGHFEIHPLRSKEYKNYLIKKLFETYAEKINRDTVDKVLGIVESEIISSDVNHILHTRLAWHKDSIWYDLADSLWRAIKIDANGWRIVTNPPILFKRQSHMKEQVIPLQGGKRNAIFEFINVPRKFHLLFLINLIACFIPNIDYPIMVFWGKPGTGKTSVCRVLKDLVDPSKADIISFPPSEKEMIQVMSKNHMIVFDNISRISWQASDILCRASTGGAFVTRELYKNNAEIVRELHQPVVMNGLYQLGEANDLISRSMFFELDVIKPIDMKPTRKYLEEFEQEKPLILGCIFDCLSVALKTKETMKIAEHDRMGDFKDWSYAIAENFTNADIALTKQLAKMDSIRNREAIFGQPLAAAVEIFIKSKKGFRGTALELYNELSYIAKKNNINTKHFLWPKGANAMTRSLNNMQENLEQAGVLYEHQRKREGAVVTLTRV